jgi:hypothetical protein
VEHRAWYRSIVDAANDRLLVDPSMREKRGSCQDMLILQYQASDAGLHSLLRVWSPRRRPEKNMTATSICL